MTGGLIEGPRQVSAGPRAAGLLEEELWMIDVTDDGDVLVVDPYGELDLTTSPRLVEAFASNNGHKELVCDLTRVSFIDSTGIQALLAIQRAEPDRFVLSGTSACVEKLFELTGTANVFRRAPTPWTHDHHG
jgi:anti-sigma B factor antagonist